MLRRDRFRQLAADIVTDLVLLDLQDERHFVLDEGLGPLEERLVGGTQLFPGGDQILAAMVDAGDEADELA